MNHKKRGGVAGGDTDVGVGVGRVFLWFNPRPPKAGFLKTTTNNNKQQQTTTIQKTPFMIWRVENKNGLGF